MEQKCRPLKQYLRVMSVFLFCCAVILLEIFLCQYGETHRFDWACLSAAVFNLGVSILLRTNV